MEEKLISIIISVYNCDKYLEKCLQSIYCSTYKNFEVICINDGSTDGSDEICRKYRDTYPQFFYFQQKNKGLAYSRNRGIKVSNGELITFLDGDDIMDRNMLEHLINLLEKTRADIAYTELVRFRFWKEYYKNKSEYSYRVCNTEEALITYFKKQLGNVCGGVFRKDIFYGVEFPVGLIYEDNVAKVKLFFNSKRIVFSNSGLYYYRINENGITGNRSMKNMDILKIGYLLKIYMSEKDREMYKRVKFHYFKMISDTFYDLAIALKKEDKMKWGQLRKLVPINYLLQVCIFGLKNNFVLKSGIFLRVLVGLFKK